MSDTPRTDEFLRKMSQSSPDGWIEALSHHARKLERELKWSLNTGAINLRDYFAAAAITGIMTAPVGEWGLSEMAKDAFKVAEEMLKLRDKS